MEMDDGRVLGVRAQSPVTSGTCARCGAEGRLTFEARVLSPTRGLQTLLLCDECGGHASASFLAGR
jgi:hypothetical protein